MNSNILQVFYDDKCYPFKDKERTVRFPIVGNAFQGAQNTTQIKFYYDRIASSSTTFIAVSKLPNGKIGSKVLESYFDDELGENYALLELNSFYTQYKGDVYISLQGYNGGVIVEYDDQNEIYEITGTPTIQATGSVKLAINYATQFVGSGEEENADLQQIASLLGTKMNVIDSIYIVNDISVVENSVGNYEDKQVFYAKTQGTYYILNSGNVEMLDNGILGSKFVLTRYYVEPTATIEEIIALTGFNICLLNVELYGDFLFQATFTISGYRVTMYDLAKRTYFVNNVNDSDTLEDVLNQNNVVMSVDRTHEQNKLYGTNNLGNETTLTYGTDSGANKIVQRDSNGQVNVPETPTSNTHATSKKYVDDNIATIKANAFIVVNTTTYPTLLDFLATTGEEGYIYLYPIDKDNLFKGYYQYIWEGSNWLDIGTTQIDLSDYYTKLQVDSLLNGKVDKTSSGNKVYGTASNGSQKTFDVDNTVGADGNIVRRASGTSQIMVPLTPSANGNAASKKYVDDLDNQDVKLTGAQTISGIKTFNSSPVVPTPTNSGDATPKGYVDSGLATKQNTLTFDNTPTSGSNNPVTSQGIKNYVDGKVTNLLRYLGSKTVAEINALDTSTLVIGDFYNVSDSGIIEWQYGGETHEMEVYAGDNIAWVGDGWDKMTIDLSVYDDKFIAAGFFEVQQYNENTGEITFVYASGLYNMSYSESTGIMTIEAN